jgi:hypothetical protein
VLILNSYQNCAGKSEQDVRYLVHDHRYGRIICIRIRIKLNCMGVEDTAHDFAAPLVEFGMSAGRQRIHSELID